MLSLRQMNVFLEVARTGSFRLASEALEISQPAVSAAIAELQREFGAALLERNGRNMQLTEAGRALERYGRQVIALLDEGRAAVHDAASGAARVRIAAVTTAAEALLPALLHGFREREPHLRVDLEVANRERIWDRLAHWEVDLVVAGRPPVVPACRSVAMRSNHLLVVAPPGSRADLSELAQMTWLLREPGSGTRAATQEIFRALGIDPPTLTIGSNGAIRECVRAGLGFSILSRDAVARDLAGGTLAVIPTPATPLERDWHIATNADRALTRGAQRFLTYALETKMFFAPGLDAM